MRLSKTIEWFAFFSGAFTLVYGLWVDEWIFGTAGIYMLLVSTETKMNNIKEDVKDKLKDIDSRIGKIERFIVGLGWIKMKKTRKQTKRG